MGFITSSMRLPHRRSRDGSRDSDDGRCPREYRSAPLFDAVRTSRKLCTVALFQRICCFLFMRLAMISLTELSTKAVEIASPRRRRRNALALRDSLRGSPVAGMPLKTQDACYVVYISPNSWGTRKTPLRISFRANCQSSDDPSRFP